MYEGQRKGAKIVVPVSWDVTGALRQGTRSTSSRGARAVLPHSKRGQEISASLVTLPACRAHLKLQLASGVHTGQSGNASTQPCNTFDVCDTGCSASTVAGIVYSQDLSFTEGHRS